MARPWSTPPNNKMILKEEFYKRIGFSPKPLTRSVLDTNTEMMPVSDSRRESLQGESLKSRLQLLEKNRPKPARPLNLSAVVVLQLALAVCAGVLSLAVFEKRLRAMTAGVQQALLFQDAPQLLGPFDWSGGQWAVYAAELACLVVLAGLTIFSEVAYLRVKAFRLTRNYRVRRVCVTTATAVLLLLHPFPSDGVSAASLRVGFWNRRDSSTDQFLLPLFDVLLVLQLTILMVFIVAKALELTYLLDKERAKRANSDRVSSAFAFLLQTYPFELLIGLYVVLLVFLTLKVRICESSLELFVAAASPPVAPPARLSSFSHAFFFANTMLTLVGNSPLAPASHFTLVVVFAYVPLLLMYYAVAYLALKSYFRLSPNTAKQLAVEQSMEQLAKRKEAAAHVITLFCKMQRCQTSCDFEQYCYLSSRYSEWARVFKMTTTRIESLRSDEFNFKQALHLLNCRTESSIGRVGGRCSESLQNAQKKLNKLKFGESDSG